MKTQIALAGLRKTWLNQQDLLTHRQREQGEQWIEISLLAQLTSCSPTGV
jgi:hypothetical protein